MTPEQEQGISWGHITPIKGQFSRTQSKEILTAELYNILQRALSHPDNLFLGNTSLFEKNNARHNAEIYDLFLSYVQIDPERLPPKFIELFDLDITDPHIEQQVISLFTKARMLDKKSGRVVFIDGKIIIFKNEEHLTHRNPKRKLTQGEKKRTHITTSFNTFEDIYAAVRSQYYTIDSSQSKKDDYRHQQKELLILAQDLKVLWYGKDNSVFQRKLASSIEALQWATNAKVLAAQLQNLKELSLTHTTRDANHLLWAKNKLEERFKNLSNIIGVVEHHLTKLEEILVLHEYTLDMLFAQSQLKNMDHTLWLKNYEKSFHNIPQEYQQVAPFFNFYEAIQKYKDNKPALWDLLEQLAPLYELYKQEHKEKLSEE